MTILHISSTRFVSNKLSWSWYWDKGRMVGNKLYCFTVISEQGLEHGSRVRKDHHRNVEYRKTKGRFPVDTI